MKIKFAILPLILVSISGLTGCNPSQPNTKIKVSFGSLVDTEYTNISYGDLYQKVNYEESMVVTTYPGKDTTCSCWRTFEYVLNDYVKAKEAIIYAVDALEIQGKYNDFGLVVSDKDPSIAFFKDGKLVEQIVYSVKNERSFFKNSVDFINFMNEKIIQPDLLYVDQTYLTNAYNNHETFVIAHTYSSCSDCSYVVPNVLMPYTTSNTLTTKVWIIDLNDIHADALAWQSYKDQWNLSNVNNETYGYNSGYVPTFQYYNQGILSSSSVFFNDTIAYDEATSTYKVVDSFYTEERKNNLSYIQGVENNVIKGITLPIDQLDLYPEYNYIAWKHEYARMYHEPLLKAFLDTYSK